LGTFIREDVKVEGMRLRLLREAAERFLHEVRAIGLSVEDAKKAISEVGDGK